MSSVASIQKPTPLYRGSRQVISAGEVGAIFTIKDEASGALERLARQFNELQGTIDHIKETMAGLGGAEDGPLAKLREQFGLVGRAGEDASGVITGAFGKVDGAVDGTIGRVDRLRESLASAAGEAEAFKFAPGGGGGSGGSGGGYHGEEGGGHGGNLMRQLEHHGGGLGRLAGSLVGGPAGAAIGGAMVGWEWFKEAGSVAQAENNLRLAGVSDAGVRQAGEQAGGYAQLGMSKLEALNAIRAVMGPLNVAGGTDTGVDAATELLPTMAKFSQLARVMKGEGGGDAGAQMYELIKGGELRDKLSPQEIGKFIEDYAQVYEGTGGKVDPKTYYQGLKYSKSAGGFFRDDFVKNYLPGIEAEEGGSTAGTMLMTSASAFLGQRFKKPALGELRQMGIYDDHDNLKDQDKMVDNPFKWMQETFMPALVKAGFTTQDQQIGEVEKLTSRNTAEAAALLGIRPGNVERTAAAIGRSDHLNDATQKIGDNDPLAAMAKTEAGLANLASALGGPFIPSITSGLSNLASGVNAAAASFKVYTNPETGKQELLDAPNPTLKAINDKASDLNDRFWNWLKPPGASLFHVEGHPENIPGAGAASWLHDRAAMWAPKTYDPLSSIHAPSIAAPPPIVNLQPGGTITGNQPITIQNNVNITGLVSIIMTQVDAKIMGAFGSLTSAFKSGANNSSAGFDGRHAPSTTDASVMQGGH
jgi:hypothetical protein